MWTNPQKTSFLCIAWLVNLLYSLRNIGIDALRKIRLYSELFWSAFSRIRTEYRDILLNFPYSVQMLENTDQNNSEYGNFLGIDGDVFYIWLNYFGIRVTKEFS